MNGVLLSTVVRSARPPFLALSVVCLALGASVAGTESAATHWPALALAVLGGLAAHASVNLLNEYADFRSGLDLHTRRTAFSGGSGALPAHPQGAAAVLGLALGLLALVLAIGLTLIWLRGWLMVPVGVLGLALVLSYTPWLNRHPWLCLIAPGLGVGPLMVLGTQIALTGAVDGDGAVASLLPFWLGNNLLLLNQYPDIEADRRSGRRHFPIAYGTTRSTRVYALFTAAAASGIVIGQPLLHWPPSSLLALLPLLAAVYAWHGARQHGERLGDHPQALAANVAAALLSPTLLALTLAFR